MAELVCQTAPGVVFACVDDLKAHYKSDWHRYNLKRKVACLPMVGQELFERVVNHAVRAEEAGPDRATSMSHLKADKQRRPARSRALQLDDFDDEEDGSGDEWEEVHGEEAEAVAMQLSRGRGARAAHAVEPPVGSGAGQGDADSMDEDEEGGDAGITLASNGVELMIGNRIIGAREFSRYYRQHPRPVDSRAITVAAASAGGAREHAMVLGKNGNAPSYHGPAVTRQHARHQRVEHRTVARLRMMTEMSSNGPQFRGFRDA